MAKQRRGKYLKAVTPNWRGTCPICGRKRVKLAWQGKDKDDNKINICKLCYAKNNN